ncbi:hypothetical protein I8751_21800 [Nostocaceae cyanobacterium CENA357]|uniref:Uncharacterized protein n=1 Tax=Atlanticothrix silvestris CENA357 TaxID=1725252 RepID=A0A8J7L7B6_9CYAN|nr:hypothetical protein [Atlanticothrix silvestris]MBH8554932.1 hypothetical protein [Atlanticothrix silvestris CENA357]
MEKLKLAEVLRAKSDFEFLAECWNDDPALQIVIRKQKSEVSAVGIGGGGWGAGKVGGVAMGEAPLLFNLVQEINKKFCNN